MSECFKTGEGFSGQAVASLEDEGNNVKGPISGFQEQRVTPG